MLLSFGFTTFSPLTAELFSTKGNFYKNTLLQQGNIQRQAPQDKVDDYKQAAANMMR